jgi:iron complex outermembrane receptor protein
MRGKSFPAARPLLVLAVMMAMLPAMSVQAQSGSNAQAQQSYNVAAGSLADVLVKLAQASGAAIVFDPQLVANKSSRGVTGVFTREGALREALKGTDLEPSIKSNGTLGVQPVAPSIGAPAAPQALAQASAQQATTLQAVHVTGSMIRSVDVEMAQPVVTITALDIQRQGFATVGQFLQNLTSASTPDISKSDPLEGGPDVGGSYVDLRGLGAQRTLVLIDGKRMGTSFDGFTNLDTIPASIIDHIDVLADGASAIYGSDAISGVINIITKKDFNGFQLDSYDGEYLPHTDGRQQQYAFTAGKTTSRGSIIFAVQNQTQDALGAGSRPYSAYPLTNNYPYNGWATTGAFGQILNPQATADNPNGSTLILNAGGDPRNIADYHQQVFPTYASNGVVTAPGDTYNYNYQNTLESSTNMKNLFSQGHYDLQDNLTANFSASYNEQGNTAELGGFPFSTYGIVDPQQPQFTNPVLSAQSYYNPYNAPGQTPQDIDFQRYLIELPRQNINKVDNYRYSVGLEGFFNVGEHLFNWDASYYDTKYYGTILDTGNFYLPNLQNALGPSFLGANGVVQCGTPGNVSPGCVPLNALAGPGGYTQSMLNYVLTPSYEHYGSQEKGPQVDLSGDIYELPGGNLTAAVGASHRTISGYDTPDVPSAQGLTTNLAGQPTSGSYDVNEAYAEVNIPLLKDLPFAQSLSLDAARRFSDYSNFGTTRNNSFKLTWKPFDDLLVRASYGTGFRAPTVGDLFGGVTTTYPFYNDPCDVTYGLARYNSTVAKNCASGVGGQPALSPQALAQAGLGSEYANGFGQEQAPGILVTSPGGGPVYAPFLQGGNPNLKPETSDSAQIGLVYSPSYLTGFNTTVDWFKYKIRNVISVITPNEVLNNCYQLGIASDCALFQRNTADNYQVSSLFSGEENQGYLETSGYDVDFSYALPKFSFGQFKLDSHTTYVTKDNTLQYPGVPISYENGMASNWRVRSNFTVSWSHRDFGAQWTLRYFSPLKALCYDQQGSGFPCTLPNYYQPGVGIEPLTQIPSVTFNDAQVYWNAPWHATISLGANNIFNRIGPYFYGQNSGSDSGYSYSASYDYGRFVYVRYSQKF